MNNMISLEKIMSLLADNGSILKESDKEMLEVLNENGEVVGCAPRFLCHRLGLMHRVVFLLIEDFHGRLLLQTRGDYNKKRFDLTVGGHMNSDDNSPVDAMRREVKEEIGLEVEKDDLKLVCSYTRKVKNDLKKPKDINYELRYVYLYKINEMQSELLLEHFNDRLEKEMVIDVDWFNLEDIIQICDLSKAADGLSSTIPHYLMWKCKNK